MKIVLILFSFQISLLAQENLYNSKSERNLSTILEKVKDSIYYDHKRDTTYEGMLKCFELIYDRPDFAYPTISIARSILNNYIYDEIKDSSLVIISEFNNEVLFNEFWKEKFCNWSIQPIRVIKRLINSIDNDDLIIAMYGTYPSGDSDLVVFKKKNKILYPIFIYPNAKKSGLYSYSNIEKLENDTIKIGYSSRDDTDIWESYNYFIIDENKCELSKSVSIFGDINYKNGNYYLDKRINTTFYNKEGNVSQKKELPILDIPFDY